MSSIGHAFPPPMRNRLRRFLLPLAVVAGAAILASGLRAGVAMYDNYLVERTQAQAQQNSRLAMPTSPQIEQQWGVRVVLVQLLADNGLVEMRYLVVDANKAAKLHADSTSLALIPWMKVEGTGLSIKSQSVMYHFQHGVGQGLDGRTYSIIYGNANNALHAHATVTIVMPDGLELQHVPVAD
jgi:hypothetical protein